MNASWSNSVFPIAAIFSFRMLGLFMLIPVFTVFAPELTGATPTLTGIALGSYGLSQGLLQMPFGILSDYYGRKKMISIGLILFAIGSVAGALSESIYGMIFARTLQGTGAIGSVLIALLADLTTESQRTKAMAIIGMTIGLSFSIAMVLSPALAHHFGLSGIFYFTALLSLAGLLLLHTVIPSPAPITHLSETTERSSLFKQAFFNGNLQRLNAGIFLQHAMLTATFFALPLLLQQQMQQGHLDTQWHFYLPLMLISFVLMVPFIFVAERKGQMKTVFLWSVALSGIAQGFLGFYAYHWLTLCGFMLLYFMAFNILEASLPSLISKNADPIGKGTAMGIYSSSQFMGIFIGGLMAGILYQYGGLKPIFITNSLLCLLWIIIALPMKAIFYQNKIANHS